MCGLSGFSGKQPVDVNALKILLLDNEVRGGQSVGVYGTQLYRYAPGSPSEVITHEAFTNAIKGAHQVIAHNRFATGGAVTKENAHPFKFGDGRNSLYGTHNGFIFDELIKPLARKYEVAPVPDVDSQLLYHILYHEGIQKDIGFDILAEIEAIAALAFMYQGKLHLYRRPSRPLFIGEHEDGIYYSSRSEGLWMIGCKYVQILHPHIMHIFENGILKEAIQVKKSILHYMPEDTTPMAWKWKVNTADHVHFPDVWRADEKKSTAHRQTTTGTGNKNGGSSVLGGSNQNGGSPNQQDGGKNKRTNEINELFEYLELDILENSVGSELENELTIKNFFEAGDLGASHVVLSVRDNVNEAPIPNWVIGVEGCPEAYTITSARGYAVLRIPIKYLVDLKHNIPKKVKIILTDPFDYKTYYTKELLLPSSRVVEGTLLVPFQSEKKAQTASEFRKTEDNLLTRAILARKIGRAHGTKFGGSAAIISHEANIQLPVDDGADGEDGGNLEEKHRERIRKIVAPTLLLLANSRPKMAGKQAVLLPAVAQSGNRPADSQKTDNLSQSSKTSTGAQNIEEMAKDKVTDYTRVPAGKVIALYDNDDYEAQLRARNDYSSSMRNEAEPQFWAEASEQLLKDERAKSKRMTQERKKEPTLAEAEKDVQEFLAEIAVENKVVKLAKVFNFLPFEKEEDLIQYYKNYTDNMLTDVNEGIDACNSVLIDDNLDMDPVELKRALTTAYGSLLLIKNKLDADKELYTKIIEQEDYLPF